ncbi:MAG: PilZ domain-containing protein [Acidimicrobiales bacterium]
MEFRRRVPRQIASWSGVCQIEGEPAGQRRECRVLDISELGVGILLTDVQPGELIGRRIIVESPTMGTAVNVRLEGEVRNAVPMRDESVRVGIEFMGLTELEHSVVKALGVLSIAP